MEDVMANLYFRELNFNLPTDEEKKYIKKKQNLLIIKVFLLRFIIYTTLILIGVLFQRIARITAPHMFGVSKTITMLYTKAFILHFAISTLSFFQLIIFHKIIYKAGAYELVKVFIVKRYIVVNRNLVFPERYRFVTTTYNENFLLDRAEIRGPLTYFFIKNNTYGYVIRIGDYNHYDYQLLC